jgi:predicted ArsR family transcriptional regulator
LSLPHKPLSKASAPETSGEAGRSFGGARARTLRANVLLLLKNSQMIEQDGADCGQGLTADECAKALHESVLAVRPRLSELHTDGFIEDSGQRRPNLSGHSAVVWRLAGCDGGAL